MTSIEWTRNPDGTSGKTWNPFVGCSKVSEGCGIGGGGCYAIGVVHRQMSEQHKGLTIVTDEGVDWNGKVNVVDHRLREPLSWRKPQRVFVNSLSDPFYEEVPEQVVVDMWAVMALAHHHTFMILTKRPKRGAEVLNDGNFKHRVRAAMSRILGVDAGSFIPSDRPMTSGDAHRLGRAIGDARAAAGLDRHFDPWPLPNVWMGTSIELDKYVYRANHLRAMPAARRFLSCEPLLGPLPSLDLGGIDWVIVGGESGPGARPMSPQWVRDLRNRCVTEVPVRSRPVERSAAGIVAGMEYERQGPAFFFKQWGAYLPCRVVDDGRCAGGRAIIRPDGTRVAAVIRERGSAFRSGATRPLRPGDETGHGIMLDPDTFAWRTSKAEAGRELDGRTWNEFPDEMEHTPT